MSEHHLAQLNFAKMKHGIDSPEIVDFVTRLGSLRPNRLTPFAFIFHRRFEPV